MKELKKRCIERDEHVYISCTQIGAPQAEQYDVEIEGQVYFLDIPNKYWLAVV